MLSLAPAGRVDYNFAGVGYYKAVCKHKSAKTCVCPNGEPTSGSKCPKNGAMSCASCHSFHKLASNKKSCVGPKSKNYMFSQTGQCPRNYKMVTSGRSECQAAAKDLKLPDKTAYTSQSTAIPR